MTINTLELPKVLPEKRNDWEEELWIKTSMGSIDALAGHTALDIDNYIIGKETDFYHLKEFIRFIGAHVISGEELKNGDLHSICPPCVLAEAMQKGSDKNISYASGGNTSTYALEVKLLHSEFLNLKSLSKERVEGLREFCLNLSQILGPYEWGSSKLFTSYVNSKYVVSESEDKP